MVSVLSVMFESSMIPHAELGSQTKKHGSQHGSQKENTLDIRERCLLGYEKPQQEQSNMIIKQGETHKICHSRPTRFSSLVGVCSTH